MLFLLCCGWYLVRFVDGSCINNADGNTYICVICVLKAKCSKILLLIFKNLEGFLKWSVELKMKIYVSGLFSLFSQKGLKTGLEKASAQQLSKNYL